MARRETLEIIRIQIDGRTRRIDLLSISPQRVVIGLRIEQRAQINGGLIISSSSDFRQIRVLIPIRIRSFIADFKPFEKLMIKIQTARNTRQAAVWMIPRVSL